MMYRKVFMKYTYLIMLYVLMTLSSCHTASEETGSPLRLWYPQPADKWTEALPIGNGRLGAMVFGGPETDRIQFNEETLWTGEPRDYHREGAVQYLPQIRQLLFEGKQAEAEQLAEAHFMGKMSNEAQYEAQKAAWVKQVSSTGVPDDEVMQWQEMSIPTEDGWERVVQDMEGIDGAVWFRKTFELPASWQGKSLMLVLGRIRDDDFTYVNGKRVGASQGKDTDRTYQIPASLLQAGTNEIMVQVINYDDKGGLTGIRRNDDPLHLHPVGEDENQISLNGSWQYAIQDDEPPAFPQYEAAYQPFGDLWLHFKGHASPQNYRRELDISHAISRVSYEVDGIQYTREYFASEPHQVIAIRLTASEPGKITFDATLNSKHKYAETQKIDDHTLGLSVKVKYGALQGASYLQVQPSGGEWSVSDDHISVQEADEATLYLTAATNYVNYQDVSDNPVTRCQEALQNVQGQDYTQIKTAHLQEYQQYFDSLSIDLGGHAADTLSTDERLARFAASPDPALVALYLQYGRYLLISSSRPGTLPANLQGIWNDELTPPWDSKYTTNINLEMNYWPAEVLHLSACHQPLFQLIKEVAVQGAKTAKAHYGCPGWVLHHNTDLWRATAPVNAANHGIWVTGGAWLSHHVWDHFLFTQDTAFLKSEGYPLMKEAARFFTCFLVKDSETGWLISTPSNSPETGGLVAGPTMDHQLIRDLFQNCIRASEILGTDQAFRDTLQEKIPQIAPNQIGQHGQLQEWLQDIDDPENHHRHVSHLWGVYPGHDITWEEDPKLMQAARQSLLYRGDEGTGWSLAWKINLWAHFKEGDHAYELVKMLLSPAEQPGGERGGSYANLFDAHPPFQIDGNFGGATGIAEMLMQSTADKIELLPALPSALPSGEINGLCARGGFVLNISWREGKLEQLEITSKAGGNCKLIYGELEKSFDTQQGQIYQLDKDLQIL